MRPPHPRQVSTPTRHAVWEGRNVAEQRCGMCGRPVDAHNRQIRFRLPEPVLNSPGQERVPGAWLSHQSPEVSVMMQIPGVGPFVRALLAVRLTGGYAVTYGVWVGVRPGDLQRACQLSSSVGTAGGPCHLGSEGPGAHAVLREQFRPRALAGPWPGMAAQGRPWNTSVVLQHPEN